MKRNFTIITIIFFVFSIHTGAQVGINSATPGSTLDIVAKNPTGSATNTDGLLIPRVDRQRAQSMINIPPSTLIYVNSISTGTATGTAVNINAASYYYYDGSVWQKLNADASNIYTSNGVLGTTRTVDQAGKSLTFNNASTTKAFNVYNDSSATPIFSANGLNKRVGVGTDTPASTLSVEGSFEAGYAEVTASTTLDETQHYITFSGISANQTITLPAVTSSFSGRIYRIKNISTQSLTVAASSGASIRPTSANVNTFVVPAGAYIEVVCNTNTGSAPVWDLSYIANSMLTNVDINGSQAKIPPHANAPSGAVADFSNHTNTAYDTSDWWLISKSSTPGNSSILGGDVSHAKQTLVYEYHGAAGTDPTSINAFNLINMFPILTAGNNSSWPDGYTANFVSIQNLITTVPTTALRTQLKVIITRAEIGGSGGNWAGTFFLNILLARRIN